MFARRIRSAYDKKLLKQTKLGKICLIHPKRNNLGDNVFFRIFKDNKIFLGDRNDRKSVGNITYIIKGTQFTHKRHFNPLKKVLIDEAASRPPEETVMNVIYDTFDILTPLAVLETRRSKRKRKATDLIVVNAKGKKKKYWDQNKYTFHKAFLLWIW